jgi:hypothetical protein
LLNVVPYPVFPDSAGGKIRVVQLSRALACRLSVGANVMYSSYHVEHDYVMQECRSEWAARVAKSRVFALEKSLLERSQHVFAVSQGDKDRFTALYPVDVGKITVAPNEIGALRPLGTDQTRVLQRFPQIASYPSRAVDSGSDVEHNRNAVRFIVDELAPARPDVAFVVHGFCGRQFAGIGRSPNVFFDTDPFRFDDYAVTGFVGINPVTTGGGTNLKVLHYLSRGLPVVSTPFGMRGHEDFQHAVTVCELADLSTALRNPAAAPASDLQTLEKYRWDAIARTMLMVYERLA